MVEAIPQRHLWHAAALLLFADCGVRVESRPREIMVCQQETIGHVIVVGSRCHTVRLAVQDGGP